MLRAHRLVGERGGRLVAIWASHGINASSVDLLVRFPQRSTVRAMRESLLTAPDLAAVFGRKKRVPRSKRKDLFVGDGTVVLRLRWALYPPRNARIERALDGLIAAVERESRKLDRICEACGQTRDPDVYLVDGFPGYFCERCVDALLEGESERSQWMRSVEPDYRGGVMLGALAAVSLGLTGGALASIAVSKLGVASVASPGATIVLLLMAAVGYGVAVLTNRGLQNFAAWTTLVALPFVLLATVVFWTTMWLVARQTDRPAPYGLGLLWASIWLDPFARTDVTAALLVAAATAWVLAFAIRVVWVLGARRTSSVERVDGV